MSKRRFGIGLVHGVVTTRSRLRLAQIADAFDAPEIICATDDRHALLISSVPRQFRDDVEADTLFSDPARISILGMAHHRILQAVSVLTDVVPIRLGTLVSGPAGAADLLTREAGRFADRLAAIRNAVEFAVRILSAPGPARPNSPGHAGSGREYLRARSDERARSRPAVVDIVLQELALRAVAVRARQPRSRETGQPPPVADTAFLVNRSKLRAFADCAERIERQIAEYGLALDMFGPLPAYSFVDREHPG